MVGVILCGGQSSRMKSDKGLLMYSAKTWAQVAFEKLSSLQIPVKLSINEGQFPAYAKVFNKGLLIVDNNSLEIKGPLLGVLSAHIKNSKEDLFILGCDLLLMKPSLLEELSLLHKKNTKSEAFIYSIEDNLEPLCAIYTSTALQKIIDLNSRNSLAKYSMKFVLSQLNVYQITINNSDKQCFKNFNTVADLHSL